MGLARAIGPVTLDAPPREANAFAVGGIVEFERPMDPHDRCQAPDKGWSLAMQR